MKKCLILLLTLLCFSSYSYAESSLIKGKIVDASNNQPIDFADVFLFIEGSENPLKQTFPDKDGSFTFNELNNGNYNILIRLIGYDVITRAEIAVSGSNSTKDLGVIAMQPLEVGLAEVEVVAQKKQIIYKLDKRIIEASSNVLASGGTAVDILENTPSIRVNAEGEVTFRGSSGFTVYINGRPGLLSGSQALEQIPAGQIANIEIITNPSARNDAQGDAGIINVITKKDASLGFSGMVNFTGSTLGTYGPDFLLTQQNRASRWYIGGTWTDRISKSDFDQEKMTIVNDVTTTSHSKGPRKSIRYNHTLRAGWSYTLPKTNFYIDLEGGKTQTDRRGDLDYAEKRTAGTELLGEGGYLSRDRYELSQTIILGTVGFGHKFNDEGHELSASFYAKYDGDAMEYFRSDLFDKNNVRQNGHRAAEDEHRWTTRGQIDYILPYRKTGKLEAGYQYFSYLEDGDYNMEFWNPETQEFYWREDIYNTFYFMHGINSIYAIISDSYKKFDFQLGLRGEHTHRVLRSSIEGADRTYNDFELFPSAHIGYNFPKEHVLTASYSRRIIRPDLFYMEPYITFRDYYTAEIGNPDIRNQFINSFELNYKKTIGQNILSASVFHRARTDKIERLRVPYHEPGITLDSMANVGDDFSTGLELSAQLQATRWWNMNINGSVYHYRVKNKLQDLGKNEKSTNYQLALSNSFAVAKNTRIQLDGNFIGPSVVTQGKTDAYWYVNLAVRQQMFNRKLVGTLSFRDVFNSARYVSNLSTSNLLSETKIRPKYPLITLTLTYTFNNYRGNVPQATDSSVLFEGTNH
ncbi:TonB-dependent receptor [Parabacteroides sp. OttesenSCG-928-G07]|nr:TonB-dependent receptor [Parabacteroides sp. OttesenSCG-928-G21]MDL2277447.1 TonB-dependent receptor [Parabacteroides sp. OttesenSCG-928-G07]